MKTTITTFFLAMSTSAIFAANIIPAPVTMEARDGVFRPGRRTRIVADAASQPAAQYLADLTGYPIASTGDIVLTTRGANPALGPEGYELTVSTGRIVICAPQPAGVFYGVQTLRQLLPEPIPCIRIEDQPRFPWRGLMLDVSRHFFNKEEIKQLLDAMAFHKLNTFHWHLVDDNGWRIEIKKYPQLTEVGAWRKDIQFGLDPKASTAYGPDGRYGGFYTQADIREIVAYAEARHITIVPEIEMPGHSGAALRACPQLGCVPGSNVYCVGNEETFAFLQDVLAEVIDLFPCQYVHIGGDEVSKGNWKKCEKCQARIKADGLKDENEFQSYFIRRIEKFINSKGRTLIGWSEIREGGLTQNAVLMDWIGGAVEGASSGHDVVMSPTSHCYFDYYQSQDHSTEPPAIGGYLPLTKVYSFEPIPAKLPADKRHHILGAQGNVWTEYIPSLKQVEYMAFPRLCALAEVVWSSPEARNWEDFSRRLAVQFKRFDTLGINYRRDTSVRIGDWKPDQIKADESTLEWDITKVIAAVGDYRVSLNWIKGAHGIDIHWVALLEDGKEITRDTHDGFAGGEPKLPIYTVNLPTYKTGVCYTIQARVTGNGGTDSHGFVSIYPKTKP